DQGGRRRGALGWRGGRPRQRAQCRHARGGGGGAAVRPRPRRRPGAAGARVEGVQEAAAAAGRVVRGGVPPGPCGPGLYPRRRHPWCRAGLVRRVGGAIVGCRRAGGIRTAGPGGTLTAYVSRRQCRRDGRWPRNGPRCGPHPVRIGTALPGALDGQARPRPVQAGAALAAFPLASHLVFGGGELGRGIATAEGVAGLICRGVILVSVAFQVVRFAAVLLVPVAGVGELLGGCAAGDLVAGRAHRRFSCSVGWIPNLSAAPLKPPRRWVIAVLGVQLATLLPS